MFDEIAPEEIANAIEHARQREQGRDLDELHGVARDLGYRRTSSNIKSIVDRVASRTIANGRFAPTGDLRN